MTKKPYFITTPIYYVNDVPHIGHAYTTVAADVYNRFLRQKGAATAFLVGTDEHGAKIAEAAAKASRKPKVYVDELAQVFRMTWEKLNIQYDRFMRTTDTDHEATVRAFLQKIYDNGFVTKGFYEGLYCVGHEKFMSPEELVDGKCPDHNRVPELYQEEDYFFALSKFRKQLIEQIENEEIEIRPLERKNEILGKIHQGLQDISISRANVPWGILMPFDPTHTIYVWIDALINYYTYGKPKHLWPADLHLIGKDILWFHAVIWPALLMAAGETPPKKIFAHGFFTIGGSKMSKTLGNVILPQELIEKFGVDAARYLLLSAFPFGADGDFDWARLVEKYNADLANGIGNLTSRITTLAAGMDDMTLGIDESINKKIRPLREMYQLALQQLDFFGAIGVIQELVKTADQYLNVNKPWGLTGEEKKEAMQSLCGMLATVAACSTPFMPDASKKIFDSLGLEGGSDEWGKAKLKITRGEGLFPRLG